MNSKRQPVQATAVAAAEDSDQRDVRDAFASEVRSDVSVSAMRLTFDSLTRLLNTRLPPLAAHHERVVYTTESTATLDVLVPVGKGPHPVLVYLHGGAWVAGSPASHRKLTARFAETGFLVLSVDYRLAPEHPFPNGLHDCLAAVEWAAANAHRYGGDPRRLTLGGDSAGGNLAAATAIELGRRRGSPKLSALALIYGVFDLRDMGSASANRSIHRAYLPDSAGDLLDDPRVSPIHDAAALPPSFIVVGRQDPLLQQSQRLRDVLAAAGTDHRYVEAAGMPHGFMQMEFLGGVRRLIRDMAAFLHEQQPAGRKPRGWLKDGWLKGSGSKGPWTTRLRSWIRRRFPGPGTTP
ncbi:MAG: alpha/beta hydrolase [Pseudomonadales bacterium]